jgi:hypothetical protein
MGWENHEPAPMEFFHSRLMEYFHEYRKSRMTVPADGSNGNGPETIKIPDYLYVAISGSEFSDIVVKAKNETYAKYPKQKLQETILKTDI